VATVPADVETQLRRWLERVDAGLPGKITGCYLVGSLAVDDFAPRVSNIDVVVCADGPWGEEERQAVLDTAGALERRGRAAHLDVVSYEELEDFGTAPDPYTRDLLYDAPALRGRRRPPAGVREGDLERWGRDGLVTRVEPWLRSHRFPTRAWFKAGFCPVVLDACRLHAATKGHVLSLTQAADLVMAEAPGRARRRKVLGEALSYRAGAQTSNYWGPVERKRDALALVGELVDPLLGAAGTARR
jgi:hypothetical protein